VSVIDPDEIDPDGPVPVYLQLANILRRQIESGKLPKDRAIPARKRLQDEYGVAQGTVEHALEVLKAEGLLITVPGRGMFVTGG
jgi:GntR family transcriptional regulator